MTITRARLGLTALLLFTTLLTGCAGMSGTTFNPAQSCQAIGGTYAGGQCRVGLP